MDKMAKMNQATASRAKVKKASSHFALELNEITKLALPMVLIQLGQVAMTATDLAFIGRIGADSLAAAAVVIRLYFVGLTVGMGLLAAIAPIAAQAFVVDNLRVVRGSVRMGLWTTLPLSLPILVISLRSDQILLAFGQAPDIARLAQQYLFGLAWGVMPALWFTAIRTFMGAVNRPKPALWITLAAIPVNAFLVYLLVFGKFGVPRLELFGAGIATTIVNYGTFLAGVWITMMYRPFHGYHVLAHLWRFDWPLMRQLIVIGTPISIAGLMECGVSSALTLLMGVIGTRALVAHQIAFQVAAILFAIPCGISMAASVRVARAVSRNDGSGIKRAGLAAMLLGIVIVTMLTAVVIAARFYIAKLFLGESVDDADAIVALAAHLLLVGASAFIAATMYSIALGSLRGLKDTRVPLVFAGIAFWLIGVSLSYVLGLTGGLGGIGVWMGLSIGTTVYAALLILRFQLLASRFVLQSRYFPQGYNVVRPQRLNL
ncbi:Multidrug resistance protein NorM [Bradyrhizobium ivorense]|uniref:Multidrug resistance protein NorM n=2 Tax=Bradyrhizobium ivorense TaxID=2511166 RepID=A0A508TVP1_9BRAD|nr:MATE family efflux transporter [Bradyrhizobium ivorense]VIO78765.1 Multidrug resistance protein NorM [Bradyrhizobium ivorense]